MSRVMLNPFIDKNAGRYSGDDDAKTGPFREMQLNMQVLRGDAIVKITGYAAQGAQYTGQELIDKTNADGIASTDANWGMNLATPTIIIVNLLEYGQATHNIPIGTRILGRRRPNADESDTIFVSYPATFLYAVQWAGFYDAGASLMYGFGNPG